MYGWKYAHKCDVIYASRRNITHAERCIRWLRWVIYRPECSRRTEVDVLEKQGPPRRMNNAGPNQKYTENPSSRDAERRGSALGKKYVDGSRM